MGESLKTGGVNSLGLGSSVLPGRKLVTSKNPRMLTPSEIDLLRQDLKAALSVVGQDEIEDAHNLFHDHGFRVDDFEILQRGDRSLAFPGSIMGTVIVV